jgi:UDP-N-acetylmuramate--alanine ligase
MSGPPDFPAPASEAILPQPDLVELSRERPVHFMGIGGAGMTALAELLVRAGGRVTGCDAHPHGPGVEGLRTAGVQIATGHGPPHVAGCAALVVTSAVPADHPELEAARAVGIPVLKRAQALGAIVNRGTVVGIAGTHGKTTTTAMTTTVLATAGFQPTGLVGGRVPQWGGNLHHGQDRLYVVEADEYDRSFHTLHPSIAVVTTLEADHLDIYGTLEAVEDAFLEFVDRVPADGLLVACGDDHGVGRLLPRVRSAADRILTYGVNAGSMLRAEEVEAHAGETRFRVRDRGTMRGTAVLRAPGIHNVRNALAATASALHLGADWEAVVEGLAAYGGVQRRFERVGEAGGVLVVDDYAHHPTEIEATLRAARGSYSERRLVAVFQPHLYSRTRDFAEAFGRALALADTVFVTDVFPAREAPIPGVSGELIASAAERAGARVTYLPDREAVRGAVTADLRPGDLCLTLGAGDLDEVAREIVSTLSAPSRGGRG